MLQNNNRFMVSRSIKLANNKEGFMSVIAGARTSMGKDKMVDRAIMQFHLSLEGKKEKRPTGPPRVIAITRQLGSGGRRIGEALGERLGWPVYDKEILEMLARKSHAGYRKEMFEAVDETTQSEIERMLNAFLGQADQYAYFYLLPQAILTLAQINCIILGRICSCPRPSKCGWRPPCIRGLRTWCVLKT
jgi:hypothetical protein